MLCKCNLDYIILKFSYFPLFGYVVESLLLYLFSTVLSGWVGGDDAVSAAVLLCAQQHGGAALWGPGCSLQCSFWPGQVHTEVYCSGG